MYYCLFNGYSLLPVAMFGYNMFGKQVTFEKKEEKKC
jgi:hypothetical protein